MRPTIALLVTRVLSSSLLFAAACGGIATSSTSSGSSGSSGTIPTDAGTDAHSPTNGFREVCQNGTVPLTAGFKPEATTEFIELRTEAAYDSGSDSLTWNLQSVEHTGMACSGAGDGSHCTQLYSALHVLPTSSKECLARGYDDQGRGRQVPGCATDYIAYTQGNTLGVAETLDQAKKFFGSINTQEEALYLAQKQGYTLGCSEAPTTQVRPQGSGYLLIVQKRDGNCDDGITEVLLSVDSAGTTTVVSQTRVRDPQPCAIGRRPAGLCDLVVAQESHDAVGEFFAAAAKLEAASVHAFARLGDELRELGADGTLLERVETARKDEIRHAKSTAALARRFGHAPQRATLGHAQKRTLLKIAIENATEGCVRETYGAIVAAYQARAAGDAEIARELAIIATDEASHAQLAWDIAAWFDERLSADERATVKLAQVRALAELREDLAVNPDTRLITLAGLPVSEVAQQLLDAAAAELFAA